MLITPQNLNLFFTNLETRFWQAYGAAPEFTSRIATTYAVSSEQWASGWIGMLNEMREWVGPRKVSSPAPQTYVVPIQNFELTESVDQFKLADDTYGIYAPMVDFMGTQAKKWSDYQLRDLLLNQGSQTGARQKGLDGLNHWSQVHPVNFYDTSYGTYSNDFLGGLSVNGVTVGGALSTTAFSTLWQEIASRKSENGEALGVMADLSMYAPQLKYTMDSILQAQFLAPATIGNLTGLVGSSENLLKGMTDSLMVPELAAAPNNWYQLVTNRAIKPFSWLMRKAPDFVYRISPQDPVVFDTHTNLYGSTARGAPAWSFAWLSARSGPTP